MKPEPFSPGWPPFGSEKRGAVIDAYMAGRATLLARLIELQRNYPPEYDIKLRDVKHEIERIDKIVLGLLSSPNGGDKLRQK